MVNSIAVAVEWGVEHGFDRLCPFNQLPSVFPFHAAGPQKPLRQPRIKVIVINPNPHWPGLGRTCRKSPQLVTPQVGTYCFWKWFQQCCDSETLGRQQKRKFVQPLPHVLSAQRVDIAFWRCEFTVLGGSSRVRVDREIKNRISMVPAQAMLKGCGIIWRVK